MKHTFDTLPHDIKYLIASFMLDFSDEGCDEPEKIEALINFIWNGAAVSPVVAGFCWPAVASRSVTLYDAARRGNLRLMEFLIKKNRIHTFMKSPMSGALEFGYIPHIEYLNRTYKQFDNHDLNIQVIHRKVVYWLLNLLPPETIFGNLINAVIASGNVPLYRWMLRTILSLEILPNFNFLLTNIKGTAMLDHLHKTDIISVDEQSFINICDNPYEQLTLKFVKWFFSKGCPVTDKIFLKVCERNRVHTDAKYGIELPIIEWFYEVGDFRKITPYWTTFHLEKNK